MADRVKRAPKLFARAAVIVDFGGLASTPDAATARALLDGLREAGVLPVALAYGSSDNEKLSVELGLPLLAKFRAQYDSTAGAAAGAAEAATPAARQPVVASAAPEKAEPRTRPAPARQPGPLQATPARPGQQAYSATRHRTRTLYGNS